MKWIPAGYHSFAVKHLLEHPYAGLFLDMGLGKTAVLLTALDYFIYKDFSVRKPLIIAPKKVIESTWSDEVEKWDHLRHLKLVKIHGSQKERLEALKQKGDIYLVSRDNIAWLNSHYMTAWPYDFVGVDESSSFKNHKSQRFRAIKMARPFIKRAVIMSGTPAPNGLSDLWAQMYILDQGKRLGENISEYRNEYLYPEPTKGFETRKYSATDSNSQRVFKQIADICISMKSEDYQKLPPRIEQVHKVVLPDETKKRYREFEKTQVLKAYEEAGNDIAAINAGALTMKLLQFANGAVYENNSRNYQVVHDEKLEAMGEIIEAVQVQGEPLLIAYQYQHDLERLKKRFGGHKYDGENDVKRWNNKEFDIMYLQANQGIGLNLQAGGCHVAHFGMNYNLESWLQFNKRLHRLGQTKPVYIHKLLTVGTIDIDVCRAIDNKDAGQEAMLKAVKARVNLYLNDNS